MLVAMATPAISCADTRPAIMVSDTPIKVCANCAINNGQAILISCRSSDLSVINALSRLRKRRQLGSWSEPS